MTREDPQMKIRLPAELKASIEEVARLNTRTINAEVVARLQESFTSGTSLPLALRDEVQAYADEHRLDFDTALARVIVGGARASDKVLYIQPSAGMTMEEMRQLFTAAGDYVPPDAEIVYDPRPGAKATVRAPAPASSTRKRTKS